MFDMSDDEDYLDAIADADADEMDDGGLHFAEDDGPPACSSPTTNQSSSTEGEKKKHKTIINPKTGRAIRADGALAKKMQHDVCLYKSVEWREERRTATRSALNVLQRAYSWYEHEEERYEALANLDACLDAVRCEPEAAYREDIASPEFWAMALAISQVSMRTGEDVSIVTRMSMLASVYAAPDRMKEKLMSLDRLQRRGGGPGLSKYLSIVDMPAKRPQQSDERHSDPSLLPPNKRRSHAPPDEAEVVAVLHEGPVQLKVLYRLFRHRVKTQDHKDHFCSILKRIARLYKLDRQMYACLKDDVAVSYQPRHAR